MTDRRAALMALLDLPDPDGMTRAHKVTVAGKVDRHQQIPQLSAMWVARHQLEADERAA